MAYLRHLSASADLITTPEEIRAGFVALALERSRQKFRQVLLLAFFAHPWHSICLDREDT